MQACNSSIIMLVIIHHPYYRKRWGPWLFLKLQVLVARAPPSQHPSPSFCFGFCLTKVTSLRSMSLLMAARQLSNKFRPRWNGLASCKLSRANGAIKKLSDLFLINSLFSIFISLFPLQVSGNSMERVYSLTLLPLSHDQSTFLDPFELFFFS